MDEASNYNVFSEANNKIYLTKCLIFAHKMNPIFQNDIKQMLSTISKNIEKNAKRKLNYKFAEAKVKLYDRCVIKSSTDYARKSFPSAAHIGMFSMLYKTCVWC